MCRKMCTAILSYLELNSLSSTRNVRSLAIVSDTTAKKIPSRTRIKSTYRRCFEKKGVLKNFAKFTGKNMCQGLFLIKRLWHRCFLVSFAKFLRLFTELVWTTASKICLKPYWKSRVTFLRLMNNLIYRLFKYFTNNRSKSYGDDRFSLQTFLPYISKHRNADKTL